MVFSLKMIITFHKDFDNFQSGDWELYQEEINNLLEAHRCGKHVLLPTRAQLKIIQELGFLSEICRSTAKKIRTQYIDFSTLRDRCSTCFVAFDHRRGQSPSNSEREIYIDIKEISNPNKLRKCRVIVEHIKHDGMILDDIFAAVSDEDISLPRCIKINYIHGGGNTISTVIEAHAAEAGPLCCVVDSDKTSPQGGYGDTAKAVIAVTNRMNLNSAPDFVLVILPVREMDNLVPIDLVDDISAGTSKYLRRLAPRWPQCDKMEKMCVAHYDTKNDVNLEEAAQQCPADIHYFTTIRGKLGEVAPKICESLSKGYARRIFDERDGMKFRKKFRQAMRRSPFFEEALYIVNSMLPLIVHPIPHRF